MEENKFAGKLFFTLITDRSLCRRPFFTTVELALKGGVKTVQLREKGLTTAELYALAGELRRMTLDFKANLIINDRVDIALAVNADGIHLGWQSLPCKIVRGLFDSEKLIGVSAHSLHDALVAQENGADYITFSPIFTTSSKSGLLEPVGPDAIRDLKSEITIPVIALGGINERNAEMVLMRGADGVAVISDIILADNPEDAAKSLYNKITTCKGKMKISVQLN
ncbi:MAG: thiamine phosphate synthase [Candidatus Loosdrechtia sp.]|uniref:thiamine phosphate synthase n=1 Tax=Candidatus Loosdrechtia sp. TaxID=3101272 RepID=UPI003A60C362|nr:MAG: thiamine phosphate synthase [Candidatus Jettenia sp. AMX2]